MKNRFLIIVTEILIGLLLLAFAFSYIIPSVGIWLMDKDNPYYDNLRQIQLANNLIAMLGLYIMWVKTAVEQNDKINS